MAIDQLIEPMFELTGYQKSNLRYILGKFGDCLLKALEKDKEVRIQGVGTFYLRVRESRPGRNPATGETVQVPERTFVQFRMHNSFKRAFQKDGK